MYLEGVFELNTTGLRQHLASLTQTVRRQNYEKGEL